MRNASAFLPADAHAQLERDLARRLPCDAERALGLRHRQVVGDAGDVARAVGGAAARRVEFDAGVRQADDQHAVVQERQHHRQQRRFRPPCCDPVEVNTQAGLPASAPFSHRGPLPSMNAFIGAAMLPKRVGLPSASPAHSSRSFSSQARSALAR
jgi:hypothetical protein